MTDLAPRSSNTQAASTRREFAPQHFEPRSNRLRLQTLVRLRWLAVVGQSLAILVVYFGFKFPLPLGICLGVVAISIWLNIFLTLKYPANLRLRNRYATLLLAYDIIQLAVLIGLTGGLANPFSLLFLVPTTVSASTLRLKWILWLEGLTLACISFVAIFHLSLPWTAQEALIIPKTYVFGIWVALVCSLVFTSIYAWRIAEENRRMAEALTATQMVLSHEQQLSALDGLAAAAAHELGTPLATIALVAKELKRELPNADDFTEDLDLLNSQAVRCREILSSLTSRGSAEDEVLKRMPLSVMLAEIANSQPEGSIGLNVETIAVEQGAEPIINRNPAILYGIGNLVENALDFAHSAVNLTAAWDSETIKITVSDDGPGFTVDILNRLGEPYVTTRKVDLAGNSQGQETGEGMGLGFFIAKTFLERTGARIILSNNLIPTSGAQVQVQWPRGEIEHDD